MDQNEIERITALLDWTRQKVVIENRQSDVYYYERELWWVSLGQNVGFEQNGKNHRFERPVIIMKKFGKDLFFGIPVTTKEKEGRWYFQLETAQGTQRALLTQGRVLSAKRLIRKVEMIKEDDFREIRNRAKDLFL